MLTYGFYNGADRTYNATQLSSLFDGIINDGVFSSVGSALVVAASSGMTVTVGTGRAWFNHTWTNVDTLLPLVVDTSEVVLNRIDVICLEVSNADNVRANSIKIVKGTPGSTPVAPTMVTTTYVHQYPLAHLYVGAGVTAITQGNITNKVGTGACPLVTGVMASMNLDTLLAQWNASFNAWFSNVQTQLTGNVATNLQNQIDLRLPLAGGTMTGDVILKGDPTVPLHPATKQFVESSIVGADVIGTVKQGATNPFGANGALCNGAIFRSGTYPTLFSALSTTPTVWSSSWLAKTGLGGMGGFKFLNNYYVFYGSQQGTGYPAFAYCSTLTGAYTLVTIYPSINTIQDMYYVNGYYVAIFNNTYVRYSNTLVSGSWALMGDGTYIFTGCAYYSGYYVFSAYANSTGLSYALYTTTLGSYTAVNLLGGATWARGIVHDGTRFVIASLASDQRSCVLYYATSVTTWTAGSVSAECVAGTESRIYSFAYVNGIYIVGGTTTSNGASWLAYSSTYNAAPTIKSLWGGTNCLPYGINYLNGKYVLVGSQSSWGLIGSCATPGGTWDFVATHDTFVPSVNAPPLYVNGEYIFCSNSGLLAETTTLTGDAKVLPTIADVLGIHSYIKTN